MPRKQRKPTPAEIRRAAAAIANGPGLTEAERDAEYRRAMRAALESEIQRRRIAEKVVRSQFQALSSTLESALKKPKPRDFLQELLRTVVRECGCIWSTAWHVPEKGTPGRRALTGYRSRGDEERIERFAREHADEIGQLSNLYLTLAETHRCSFVINADDKRVPPWIQEFYREMDVQTGLVVPLFIDDEVHGWMSALFSSRDGRIPPDYVGFIETAAHQATLVFQLDQLASAERQRVLTAERNRIARDMHDLLAQSFSAILLQIEAMRAESPGVDPRILDRVEKIRFLAGNGVEEVRRALTLNRPALLDQMPLPEALAQLTRELEWIHSVPIHFCNALNGATLPSKAEVHLFAIASEAIQNAIQHAQPTQIKIALRRAGSKLTLEIHDNGRGLNQDREKGSAPGHFGLENMKERAHAIGAELSFDTRPRQGTTVSVTLQLN